MRRHELREGRVAYITANGSLPTLSEPCVVGVIWRCLDNARGGRPTVQAIAHVLRRSERRLRREWRQHQTSYGFHSLRELITYACLSYGLLLISRGDKCVAASRLAGFRSHWNFNRQAKLYAGGTARASRARAQIQLDPTAVALAMCKLDDELLAPGCARRNTRSSP